MRTTRSWWLHGARGVIAIAFAVMAGIFPAPTGVLAVHLYGAFLKIDGLLLLALGFSESRAGRARRLLCMVGALSLASGLLVLIWPMFIGWRLAPVLAVSSIGRGLLECAHAVLGAPASIRRPLLARGILSIGYGVLLSRYPHVRLPTLMWGFAAFAVLSAAAEFAVAATLRRLRDTLRLERMRHYKQQHDAWAAAMRASQAARRSA